MYTVNPELTTSNPRLYEHGICIILYLDTARTRTPNLFCPKCTPIPLGHSDRGKPMKQIRMTNGDGVQMEESPGKVDV